MAFFDKLGDFAKNIGDKTNEALEASRLNGKVNALKAAIAEEHRKLGEHFYQRYTNGETLDPECAEVCSALDEKNREMDALFKESE